MGNFSRKKWILIVIMVVGLALVVAAGVYWLKMRNSAEAEQASSNIEPSVVVQEVGRLIELPTDEEPSVAVVRDVSKLQEQEIFRKAKNGDILLIYVKARRAYLYDRTIGKLVDVAPVNLQEPSPSIPSSQ